jgi:thymidylate kinase
MEKREEKKNRNCENFLELDNENQRKRIELKKKLDGFEKRKREISEKNRVKITEMMEKERQSLIKIQEKKKKSDEEKNIYYDNILKYQTSVIKRGDLKESSSELSRTSA